ncbi:MAG: class I SAM-dependent methyltransferase [Bacteroidota bacterium]|nr:class I SAM-dependent methyltransferase [Bacteroidota bacterium]
MTRIELINQIFDQTDFTNYLEIGTEKGFSLLPIKCKNKISVDPFYKIKLRTKLKWLIKIPANFNNKYFEETSDDFFDKRKKVLQDFGSIDIAFLDGLHTFEASLNDVLNSLKYLNPKGIIIMHDCFPPHKAAGLPTRDFPRDDEQQVEGWTGEWCGDVWKTIVYLRTNLSEHLDVCVINTDYGLGIIRIKSKNDTDLSIDKKSFDEIDKMDYDAMIQNGASMIDLKNVDYAKKIIEEVAANFPKV